MRLFGTILTTSSLLALVACGTADPNGSSYCGGNPSAGGLGNGSNAGGENGLGGSGNGSGTSKPAGDFSACASATAGADPKPVYLVFAYDRSGSMADDGKWGAAKAAMEQFFSSADSKGISASLAFFPSNSNLCSTSSYSNPQVPITALPSTSFATQLDKTSPNGETPTLNALTGAIDYAQSIQSTTAKDGTIAVVMVTDGLPQGCSDDLDVGPAADEAQSVAATIPTYVVGVGDLLDNLNQIASAGGTKSAFVVSVGDPAKTQSDLSTAINQIRLSALSCDYGIPAPPSGQTLDPNQVNVQYTPSGGSATALAHNQGCAGGTGWQYDDPSNPKRILACDGTCNDIKSKAGKVDVVFGCATVNAGVQ